MNPFEVFLAFFLTFLDLMLQKGYLDQIVVEFHQKLIGAIVNWPTPNWKTFLGSMGLLEGIFGPFFLTSQVLMLQKGAIVNLPNLKRRTLWGSMGLFEGIGSSVRRFP